MSDQQPEVGVLASATPGSEGEDKQALLKRQMAQVLSRLAAQYGIAVPAFRFDYLELGHKGVLLEDLAADALVAELWLAHFEKGVVQYLAPDEVDKTDFPLVWVSAEQVYLVSGRSANGVFHVEDAQGLSFGLDKPDQGQLLRLRPLPAALTTDEGAVNRSAKAWFRFALVKHRGVFVEAVFATFVVSLLALFTSLYTMQVYDRVVPTKGFSTLWVLTIGVALAIMFEFLMKQSRAHIVDRASKGIDLELSGVFFAKAMSIRMDARPATVGTFASQIRHFESVRNFMTSSTLFIMADAPFALFFIAVIWLIGGPIALVPIVVVPLAVGLSFFLLRKVKKYSAQNMKESNEKNGLLIEAIDGAESVKACGAEWKMQDRYRALTSTIADTDLKMKDLSARATNLSQSVQQVNYVGMVAVGAYLVTTGELTMGGLIACSIIAGRALTPISQIPQLVMQWNQAKIALEALDGIMAMPDERAAGERLVVPASCRGEVEARAIKFGYDAERPILDVKNFVVKPGERVAILGAVGSGKSTLIKLLAGLYKPSEGSMLLDGVDMLHMDPVFLREHIGYLPQDVRLFNGSLRENLTLGLPTPNDSRLLAACKLTGLDAVVASHPKGLELMISEGGRGLSGGQRQLVGLTRLLLARPSLMILDEPTASMDAQLEAKVMRHLFEDIPKASSLIVVTHKPGLLAFVDRVVVLDKGVIAFDGPRDKVLAALKMNATKSVAKGGEA
ncbi:type I secretion system permease/ATPase [Thiomicrospira microaerophila]|uniref:type I secretion system permease/ATPase n=1 Tax=Thiomicrospira microaerophila TaxID=406020 RepID=UPI000697CC55|nr:type I secretion system permease/ATPase [Thiomicrospira microaerophila]